MGEGDSESCHPSPEICMMSLVCTYHVRTANINAGTVSLWIFDTCVELVAFAFLHFLLVVPTSSLSPNTLHDVSIHADGHIFVYT